MSMECQGHLSNSALLFRIQTLEESLAAATRLLKDRKHETIRLILDNLINDDTELSSLSPDTQECIEEHEATPV